MNEDFSRQFTKCPCCGSERRFLEQLGEEIRARGLTREEWKFHMDVREGVVIDKVKEASILIGAEVPTFAFMTDICSECGCIYATDITRGNVRKPAPQIPNRAQRRRDAREGGNPFSLS